MTSVEIENAMMAAPPNKRIGIDGLHLSFSMSKGEITQFALSEMRSRKWEIIDYGDKWLCRLALGSARA